MLIEAQSTAFLEEEGSGCTRGEQEIRRARVGDRSSGSAGREYLVIGIGFGDHDDERIDRPSAVIERAEPGAIVGDPPWAAGPAGEPPWIDKVRISHSGYAGCVRHQIDLVVMLSSGT